MRVLIVEDEPLVAQRLERFCREILGPRLESLHTAPTFNAAEARLAEYAADLVLLDLNLEGRDGMELLQASVARSFHTIIVSANTEHALRAFEFGVLDFVPKPFSRDRLARALARAAQPAPTSAGVARHLAIKKHGRVETIAVEAIAYVRGAGNYSEIVLRDGHRELHDKSLERLQDILPGDFTRIHKSYLVRLADIVALHAHEGSRYDAELRGGTFLPIGRTRYRELRARFA